MLSYQILGAIIILSLGIITLFLLIREIWRWLIAIGLVIKELYDK